MEMGRFEAWMRELESSFMFRLWRLIREKFGRPDDENVADGVDITDRIRANDFDPDVLIGIQAIIEDICRKDKNIVFVGKERKGLVILKSVMARADLESQPLPFLELDERISGRNVLFFDDAINTANTVKRAAEHIFELGGRNLVVVALLSSESGWKAATALPRMHPDHGIKVFSGMRCKDEDYSRVHSGIYPLIDQGVFPIIGDPLRWLIIKCTEIELLRTIFDDAFPGGFYPIDGFNDGSILRATIDFTDEVRLKAIYDIIGKRTGLFTTIEQVKVRIFFFVHDNGFRVGFRSIVYPNVPESFRCRSYGECRDRKCRGCIETMISEIMLESVMKKVKEACRKNNVQAQEGKIR